MERETEENGSMRERKKGTTHTKTNDRWKNSQGKIEENTGMAKEQAWEYRTEKIK